MSNSAYDLSSISRSIHQKNPVSTRAVPSQNCDSCRLRLFNTEALESNFRKQNCKEEARQGETRMRQCKMPNTS